MMGRYWCVSFEDVAVSAAQDLFEVTVPAGMQYKILEARIAQSSDFGAAEAEQLVFKIKRHWGGFTSGSGGSSVTPVPHSGRDRKQTAPTDWEVNNTVQLSGGNSALLYVTCEAVEVGLQYLPAKDIEPVLIAGDAFTISVNAPADEITMSGILIFQEQSENAHK